MSSEAFPPAPGDRMRELLQEAFDARRGRIVPDDGRGDDEPLSEEELRVWSRLAESVQRLPAASQAPSAGFTDRVMAAWAVEQAAGGFDDETSSGEVEPAIGGGAAEERGGGFAWRSYGPWIAAAASALFVLGAGLAARQMGFGGGGTTPVVAVAVPHPQTKPNENKSEKLPVPAGTLVAVQAAPAAGAAPEQEKLSDLVGKLGAKSWSLAESTGSEMQDVALLWKQPAAPAAVPGKRAGGLLGPWTADSKRVEDQVFQAVETLWNGLPPL